MITVSNLPRPMTPPRKPSGTVRVASVDVEWTKNYRIKNGNRPFCFSLVWLDLCAGTMPADLEQTGFAFTSVYVEDPGETGDLVAAAAAAIRTAAGQADLITGHQLCSDLAVLEANATTPPQPVTEARTAWKDRRTPPETGPRYIDTRFDAGHLLEGASRRLVDVCTELGLDVTQPELRGTSMTALHHKWIEEGSAQARERISVLNVRHSLSTAYVAAHAEGLGRWDTGRGLNVNRAIAKEAAGAWPWLTSSTFTDLLGDTCRSATVPS
ncbi:hypothetical protein ACFV42_46440 [Streptomyces solisilvae]|uniref:hypothetical protein n=1 Tax=Streptomyces malaysiensis TaxID=92644 RepID=UPI0036C16830